MNEKFEPELAWFKEIYPEGILLNTSTVISGPGGSGKPIIAYALASEWLKKGGKIILFLTSTTYKYTNEIFKVFGIDLEKNKDKVFVALFNPTLREISNIAENIVEANFLYPEHWDKVITMGKNYFEFPEDVFIIASALNLLYFSPTYKDIIQEKLKEMVLNYKEDTLIFTLNSQAYKQYAKQLEDLSDNLMISEMQRPAKLLVKAIKGKDVPVVPEKLVHVPIPQNVLLELKEKAEKGRTHLVPILKKI